ncbi:unnamed protein product [Ceutorhynchus assimilis]|uniref:Tudor domain-containing protein n=1 Tax=Ceutorhynchus assimilis TaxID=467358 RepID=A0A9N9QNW6_9CUCU|nr:unnamed protein product [Ceutorhynchus assimilis]
MSVLGLKNVCTALLPILTSSKYKYSIPNCYLTIAKSLAVFLGITAVSLTSYVLYQIYKKNDEDELLDHYTSNTRVLEIKMPKEIIGSLIGRNGSNLKRLQDQSNTRISFKELDNKNEKICLIRGAAHNCEIAYNLIQDFINSEAIMESEDFWVPIGCVKQIVGRGGDKIKEIQSLSGAKLTVFDDEKGLSSRRISIKGTREQIIVAKSLIEDLVVQSQHSRQVIEESLAKREPRLPAKSPEAVKKDSPKCERMSPIPGQPDNQFEVYVSAMENPSRFWLQIVGPKATELDCLVDEMTEYYNKSENRSNHCVKDVQAGDLVAAIFRYDSKWYRAEVLEVSHENNEKMAKLYYVDYGDTDVFPCKDLYELRTDLLRLHFQAIECFLAKVDPMGDSWTEEAIDRFEELCHVAQWKKLSARINGYMAKEKSRTRREGSPVPGVDLYNVTSHEDIDVAEELVKAGFAVYKRGSDLRSNSRTTSTSNISVASSS